MPGIVAIFTAADVAGRTEPICVAGEVHTPERLLRELKPLDRLHPIPLFPTSKVTYVGQPVAMIVAETPARGPRCGGAGADRVRLAAGGPGSRRRARAGCAADRAGLARQPRAVGRHRKGTPDASVRERAGGGRGRDPNPSLRGFAARAARHPRDSRSVRRRAHRLGEHADPARSAVHPRSLAPRVGRDHSRRSLATSAAGSDRKGSSTPRTCWWCSRRASSAARCAGSRSAARTSPRPRTRATRSIASRSPRPRTGGSWRVRDDVLVNFGAFNVIGLVVPYNTLSHLLGAYDIPHARIAVRCALTNTCFTTPYRGAGRPEAVFAMERIIDRLAASSAWSRPTCARGTRPGERHALRHRAPVPRRQSRRSTTRGTSPNCCAARGRIVDLDAIRARTEERRARKPAARRRRVRAVRRGLGHGPVRGRGRARAAIGPGAGGDGRVQPGTGSPDRVRADHGRRARRAVRRRRRRRRRHRDDRVRHRHDREPQHGDRGQRDPSAAITVQGPRARHRPPISWRRRRRTSSSSTGKCASRALPIARFRCRRSLRRRPAPSSGRARPATVCSPRRRTSARRPSPTPAPRTPRSSPSTRRPASSKVERYVVVHDCGRVVNPLLADAQVVGGVVQGIGGVLREEIVYDDSGQPLTGSFQDYALPIASDVPRDRARSHREPLDAQSARREGTRRRRRDRSARRHRQRRGGRAQGRSASSSAADR